MKSADKVTRGKLGVAVPSRQARKETIPPQQNSLLPEDWDFREIREDQLEAAIYYEYARSCDWVLDVFKRWHRKKFQPEDKRADLGKWTGLSIRDMLCRRDAEDPPPEVREWHIKNEPAELETRWLNRILEISRFFPDPFPRHTFQKLDYHVPRYLHCPAAWIATGRQAIPPLAWLLNSPTYSYVGADDQVRDDLSFLRHIVVDLRFSKTRIREKLIELLESIDDSNIQKIQLPKGKAATPPWYRLKELAACRLHKLGKNCKDAQRMVFEQRKQSSTVCTNDVLPFYKPSGFSEAVKNAEEYIRKLFPNP
jgi:hypothetical protein